MTEPDRIEDQPLHALHPADIADELQRCDAEDAVQELVGLPPKLAASAFGELEAERAEELMALMGESQLKTLLINLPHPDAADMVGYLPADRREEVLNTLPAPLQADLRGLLVYPDDSAGGIMNDHFIALRADLTLAQVLGQLRSRPVEDEQEVSYLYVTDTRRRLVGIVSIRDLVFKNPDSRVSEIMNRDVQSVPVTMDQEALALEFEHYHYLGLPVVDDRHRLVGIVKASDILVVAKEEATEDMQLMVGLSGEERLLTPWYRSLSRRLPWLYVNLGTAFLAAMVVNLFESTIATWTALAVFLPIVAGQGGNAGMQTLTVIIRDMALGEITPGDGRRALMKEALLGLINGLAVGLVVGIVGWLWKDSPELGLVAGAAMVLNQLAAALSGVLIPFGMKRLNLDPALASSIFLTTVTDVAGFFFFLALAALLLRATGVQ
jgi:magnesium transporter